MKSIRILLILLLLTTFRFTHAQQSVARQWNEVLLEAIRNDYARPTIHARNLFHISAGMYDAWASYSPGNETYFLGKTHGQFHFDFDSVGITFDIDSQQKAISYTAYRLITYRFRNSPGSIETIAMANDLMTQLNYDVNIDSKDHQNDGPAALGNYLADQIIQFGLLDGSNEENNYSNQRYTPQNDPLYLQRNNPQNLNDPNKWQPLYFDTFIDQSGNFITAGAPEFLSPEWGDVLPFALKNPKTLSRDNIDFILYHDPGTPAHLIAGDSSNSSDYKWNFSLVSVWSSHLDPADGVMLDISPATVGNLDINTFPRSHASLRSFYNLLEGGDPGMGYAVNPVTGMPYDSQIVPRGDYARVLAEFWADGPDSETPPGHWFTLLNDVTDHPLFTWKLEGKGREMNHLEWDVKSYFTLGGAMHDAAISSWAIKGYYDFIRPISAIRYMAQLGQSSNPDLPGYHIDGIPLIPGLIEIVNEGEELAGLSNENVGKIKLYNWKGHDYIIDPRIDAAGVGWILAENWWPYQRPTFVTPPFAGYVSGHSTYSRAAAKVLTMLTGDEYFPGGMGEYTARKNEFLVFEKGPSQDVILQWAKYYDASDQCSLSRIWGGIHPPLDDIPGRLIGDIIGTDAFMKAKSYFKTQDLLAAKAHNKTFSVYPNPVSEGEMMHLINIDGSAKINIISMNGKIIKRLNLSESTNKLEISVPNRGIYIIEIISNSGKYQRKLFSVR